MNDIIKITARLISNQVVQTVDARALHSFLEIKENFATWIKLRIDEYGFIENEDFVSFLENPKKPKGGRPNKDYHLTISMGKELGMVERNDKGRQVRRYFIECENQLFSSMQAIDAQLQRLLVLDERSKALATEGATLMNERKSALKFIRPEKSRIQKLLEMNTPKPVDGETL